ncbi:hypothetical protein C6503_05135 [Candidatus Poribacteria bacterium]|nr:MAG: hypothetical protein C6503_05135 [Candidatus Poribacteria bacterium]
MKRYLMPIYFVLFLIGATALWYFGHHRPAQKILEAEPKKIYKSTPLPPKGLSVKPVPSDSIQEPREENTNIEVEGIDSASTPKKMDSNQDWDEGAGANKLVLQEDISVDDPAAAEAFEKYIAAEADYQAALEAFNKTLNLDQIMSSQEETLEALKKFDQQAALESLNRTLSLYNRDELETLKEARRQRREALENLAPYSEDATKLLEEMKEAERRAAESRVEYDATIRELDATIRELEVESREMDEILENLRSK